MVITHPHFRRQAMLGDAFGAGIGGALDNVFNKPIVSPGITGGSFLKMAGFALAGIFVLGALSRSLGGGRIFGGGKHH